MSVILMTTMSYMALILQGEIWCWSPLGLKGVKAKEPSIFLLAAGLVFKAEKEFADQRISHICWLFLQRFGGAEKGRGIGWSHVHADTKKTSRTLAINEMSFQSWNHETVAIARGRYPRALAPRSFPPLKNSRREKPLEPSSYAGGGGVGDRKVSKKNKVRLQLTWGDVKDNKVTQTICCKYQI